MKEEFKKIAEDILTKQDLVYLLDDIAQLKNSLYQEGQSSLEQTAKSPAGAKLVKILKQKDLKNKNNEQENFLKDFEQYLKNIPQVKLTLAFTPSDSFTKKISHWLEQQTDQKIILDLTIDHTIVGGAIIEYQGQHRNFALAKSIKQLVTP